MEIDQLIKEIVEARVMKIVNRKGQIRKRETAGVSGKKVTDGHVQVIGGQERRNRRLGLIKKRRTLASKSLAKKRRSALFAALGRKKRKQMSVSDTRK